MTIMLNSPIHDVAVDDKESKALTANLIELYNKIVKLSPGMPDDMGNMAKSIEHPSILADMITSTINLTTQEKQTILEIEDVKSRLKEVTKFVNYQVEILELGSKIQTQVKGDMDKKQKDY